MSERWIKKKLCSVRGSNKHIHGITVDKEGNIYFTLGKCGLWKTHEHENNGQPLCLFRQHGLDFRGIVWNGIDKLFIANQGSYNTHYQVLCYDGGNISTTAGSGTPGHQDGKVTDASFTCLQAIAMDKNGDLYVTDYDRLRKVNLSEGTVETIAGPTGGLNTIGHKDGQARSALFNVPDAISVSQDGTIFVAELLNNCIRKIKDGIVSTIHCKGSPCAVVSSSDGTLFVGNFSLESVIKVNTNNSTITNGPTVNFVTSMIMDNEGTIYVTDKSGVVFKFVTCWKKYERYLWIGNLKEDACYCLLANLPHEVIRVIGWFLSSVVQRKESDIRE